MAIEYDVEVVALNVTTNPDQPNTVNISWRVKNLDTVECKAFSDVSIAGENIESYSTILAPGDTYDYYKTYDNVPGGDVECCVDATGADTGII